CGGTWRDDSRHHLRRRHGHGRVADDPAPAGQVGAIAVSARDEADRPSFHLETKFGRPQGGDREERVALVVPSKPICQKERGTSKWIQVQIRRSDWRVGCSLNVGEFEMHVLTKWRALVAPLGAVLVAMACGTSSTASGGTVKVMAEWSGQEQANFLAVVKPFQDSTGIHVSYESTRDLTAVIKTRVAAGNPPDLAGVPNPQLLSTFASQGKLTPLDGVLDMSALHQNYSQGW